MKNIAYFINEARTSTQQEFNDNWNDIIIYRDTESVNLITQDMKRLTLTWKDGKYLNYSVR